MSHVEGFSDRDGIDRLVKLGKAMCAIVAAVSPLLLLKYPNNETIVELLAAIGAVCLLLPTVEAEFLVEEGTNEIPLESPELIPGINPSLPVAPDPTA